MWRLGFGSPTLWFAQCPGELLRRSRAARSDDLARGELSGDYALQRSQYLLVAFVLLMMPPTWHCHIYQVKALLPENPDQLRH